MKRCTKCILPETFPGIEYDSDGVCSVCTKSQDRATHVPSLDEFKVKLDGLIAEVKSQSHQYDALVAYSGGKDSTYLIYELQEKFGLRLLAFTLDNGFIPKPTFSNMRNVLEKLGVDHFVFKPRHDLTRRIFSVSGKCRVYPISLLKFGSSICISCIRMINNMSLRMAIEKGIPMVMLGNSPGQLVQSENETIYKDNRIPYELKRALFKPLADKIGDEVYYYFLLDKDDYRAKPFPYTINPLPIIGYDESTIYRTISELGWKRPGDVDSCSTNCQLNSLGILWHKEQLNFHPYDYELSMLVRLGKISREEALERVEDPENKVLRLAREVEKRLE